MRKLTSFMVAASLVLSVASFQSATVHAADGVKKDAKGHEVMKELKGSFKVKLDEVKALQKQNIDLNKQIRKEIKAFKEKAKAELKQSPTDEKVKDIQAKIEQIRNKMDAVVKLRVEKKKAFILLKEAVKKKDEAAVQAAYTEAKQKSEALIQAKQEIINYVKSL